MYAIFLLVITLMALALVGRMVEASRRHVACVRFEHELRRSLDGRAVDPLHGAGR